MYGAWHGGWCWRRVADLLQEKGHKVFTPTLTGLGERSHLLSTNVNLETHIADIVNLIKWEDLRNISLVAHSDGGWPGSGAIEQTFDRISSIVWVDAHKPEDGQRAVDFAPEFSRRTLLETVDRGEAGQPAPKAEVFLVNERGPCLDRFKNYSSAEWRFLAADSAYRRTGEGAQEGLHPRRSISATRIR